MTDAIELVHTSATRDEASAPRRAEQKVVVHLLSGSVVKGHVAAEASPTKGGAPSLGSEVEVRLQEAEQWARIPLCDVKAIFYVKSLRGDNKRRGLRFYSNGPHMGPVWAEVRFLDNEVLEGTIENSLELLLGEGFLLRPSDTESNNQLIYVRKSAIQSFRVLGVRTHPVPSD